MHRTRLTIFTLFWMAWVVVVPFAHHHLVRAPRDSTSIHDKGHSSVVHCVACQWEATSTAEVKVPVLVVTVLEVQKPLLAFLPSIIRLLLGDQSPRAPPLV
ncbi:MAG: hypothetical protein ACUVTY_05290 [Armatimonadota bacterium]